MFCRWVTMRYYNAIQYLNAVQWKVNLLQSELKSNNKYNYTPKGNLRFFRERGLESHGFAWPDLTVEDLICKLKPTLFRQIWKNIGELYEPPLSVENPIHAIKTFPKYLYTFIGKTVCIKTILHAFSISSNSKSFP